MCAALAPFIERWSPSGRSGRADKQVFLSELCLALGVPRPHATIGDPAKDRYVFEREVHIRRPDGSVGRGVIDLYKEGCFVLQVKQSSAEGSQERGPRARTEEVWNNAMERARTEAVEHAANLELGPPFVVVCDIGHCFDLYACFDGTARYRPFPDAERKRLPFDALARHEGTLRTLWTAPFLLDRSKRAEKSSVELAKAVAVLAADLELAGHPSGAVAQFLLRCAFTMLAEDVGLLPYRIFSSAIEAVWIPNPAAFQSGIELLWRGMSEGHAAGSGGMLGLQSEYFEKPCALPVTEEQLRLLLGIARHDWFDVEPAVLGGLLGRALAPSARHLIDAQYSSRAYLERLVQPTVEAPLRADWNVVRAEVWLHSTHGRQDAARKSLHDFQSRLTRARVLDPACGAGGFLCVALHLLQRLESEVLAELGRLGETRIPHVRVSPVQMRGLARVPLDQAITELSLWLAHLQWAARMRDGLAPRPGHRPDIERRDPLLAWDAQEPVLDGMGRPVTRWDGETMRRSPVTGELMPDETAQVLITQVLNPRKAEWPRADFIVGNPPFMGKRRMRSTLGEGHMAALRAAYPEVPEDADLAMYFWDRAARLAREDAIRRFGFIIPVSRGAQADRRVFENHLDASRQPLRIVFAIPDHPWADSGTACGVRVAMSVAQRAGDAASPRAVLAWLDGPAGESIRYRGVLRIGPELGAGVNVAGVRPLAASSKLCSRGISVLGSGFVVGGDDPLKDVSILNPVTSLPIVRPYLRGRDAAGRRPGAHVIDLFGLAAGEAEQLAPEHFRRVAERVRPEREHHRRTSLRERWWRFGYDAPVWRAACAGLQRYIATSEIAKHRVFLFFDRLVLPDTTLVNIGLDDAYFLGVLSSHVHTTWASASGSRLADRSRYDRTACFESFPFPACTELHKRRVRELGEALDAHRWRRLNAHPELTITGMYNVLAKLRSGEDLDERDRVIHAQGAISVLRQIHADLDRAVLDAYGWPVGMTEEQILEKLVALNHERRGEERNGLVRRLRPDFQSVAGADATTRPVAGTADDSEGVEPLASVSGAQIPWPRTVSKQIIALRDVLASSTQPWSAIEIAAVFNGARKKAITETLAALTDLGVLVACGGFDDTRRWALSERTET